LPAESLLPGSERVTAAVLPLQDCTALVEKAHEHPDKSHRGVFFHDEGGLAFGELNERLPSQFEIRFVSSNKSCGGTLVNSRAAYKMRSLFPTAPIAKLHQHLIASSVADKEYPARSARVSSDSISGSVSNDVLGSSGRRLPG